MKRLKLDAFKSKNLNKDNTRQIDQLLGQVLGDCHDKKRSGGTITILDTDME